jgi:hypothetical protein
MTPQALYRWLIALLIGIGVASAAGAQPIDTRCLADGGDALCTEPVAVASPPDAAVDAEMWTYNVCDVQASFPVREAAWHGARWKPNLCRYRPVLTLSKIVNDAVP